VLAAAVMGRGIAHGEAEVRWHDELDARLAGPGGGDGPVGSLGGGAFEVEAPRKTAFEIADGRAGGVPATGRAGGAPAEGAGDGRPGGGAAPAKPPQNRDST
jgi:hypothetical protein